MKIKRFFAKDMRSALKEVKEALGADAVIMSKKKLADGIELVAAASDLNRVNRRRNVNNLPAEDINTAFHFGPLRTRSTHLNQHQLSFNVVAVSKIDQLHDVNQFVQLLRDLLNHLIVTNRGDGQTR